MYRMNLLKTIRDRIPTIIEFSKRYSNAKLFSSLSTRLAVYIFLYTLIQKIFISKEKIIQILYKQYLELTFKVLLLCISFFNKHTLKSCKKKKKIRASSRPSKNLFFTKVVLPASCFREQSHEIALRDFMSFRRHYRAFPAFPFSKSFDFHLTDGMGRVERVKKY